MLVLAILLAIVNFAEGHGRLWEPPSRSSMWRRGYNTSINIDDNELSCGGFTNQWIINRGRCGVCGDPYQQQPRDNENGGIFASGLITRTYPVGSIIEVVIGFTANHGGYFEFKLCPLYDGLTTESQDCMDKYKLAIFNADGDGYQYYIQDNLQVGEVRLSVILPPGLYCKHCVLQWKYRTGTRWGCDAAERCGQGKGPQEEFYGCADIAIADIPNMIHLVPRLTKDQDNVGLNDLGSKHHRNLRNVYNSPASVKPIVKYVAHKSMGYKSTPANGGFEQVSSRPTTSMHAIDKFNNEFIENLLLTSIRSYYRSTHTYIRSQPCTAVPKYLNNPIINEWCRKTCPSQPKLCPISICDCENRLKQDIPSPTPLTQRYTDNHKRLRVFAKDLITHSKPRYNTADGQTNLTTKERLVSSLPVPKNFIHSPKVTLIRTNLYHEVDANKKDQEASGTPIKTGLGQKVTIKGKGHWQYPLLTPGDYRKTIRPNKSTDVIADNPAEKSKFACTASVKFAHNEFMADWCTQNCSFGFCPRSVCSCTS